MIKFLGLLFITLILSSCSSWKIENLTIYKSINIYKFFVYTESTSNYIYFKDFENIEKNIRIFFNEKLELKLNEGMYKLAILPLKNEVINFASQGSTATCNPDEKLIILADFYNFPKEIYEKYGEPPKDILITAFTHELTHCLTLWQNSFGFSGKMQEALAVFSSYIDFRNTDYKNFNTNSDLRNDLIRYYTKDRIELLLNSNLDLLEINNTRELDLFITYLHLSKKYDHFKEILFSIDIKDFKFKVNWSILDTKDFINWINITTAST